MFTQFHNRYPTGSLVSELLQIHEGNFIVRALVQVGGITLASGMAADLCIERAEDQARLRALAILGLPQPPYDPQGQFLESGQSYPPARLNPAPQTQQTYESAEAIAAFSPAEFHAEPRSWREPANPDFESGSAMPSDRRLIPEDDSLYGSDTNGNSSPPLSIPRSKSDPQSGRGRSSKPSTPPISTSRPTSEPTSGPELVDLSEIIAQTSVELKRLGWSEAQGRTHLQRTYNKRSRQQLSDDELLDFLNFLQSEPAIGEPSF